ncbi:hypothetical protein CTEN210_09939 [Chaetoceros tenuissimus]|uniref:Uncharacterized protein n=1 Tax=Chaetoceros tenuissimus TaxID=426638 RepID=A0AAD3H833_9STRA|nr:hypothetical protein CTEN210_09939 [Chaetoceros tenuissimus]
MQCIVLLLSFYLPFAASLSISRRNFVASSSISLILNGEADKANAASDQQIEKQQISRLLEAKNIYWSDGQPSWKDARYRGSTLSSSSGFAPTPSIETSCVYPDWIEGYWSIKYKFQSASFPQGRSILSLRTGGAGLGTCMSLPNVGYNPSAFSSRYIRDYNGKLYYDVAYNVPRRFEAFWPEAKVTSISVGMENSNKLTPKCFVTGEGCMLPENPSLHSPTQRYAFDFEGPTRRSGRMTQSTDVTEINSMCEIPSSSRFEQIKTYSQYNVNQDLQTFYKEIKSFEKINSSEDVIIGKVRAAAFLPYYIKELDNLNEAGNNFSYDENAAVAIYDYKFLMKKIDESEAASM